MENYSDLNKQFINGQWLDGSESDVIDNLNPYNGNLINTFKAAGKQEVDDAYTVAKQASISWSKTNPLIRRDLMLRAADIIMKRKDEIAEWLINEAGGTALKAQVEIKQSYDMLIEASGYPTRMHGCTIPSFTDGKETYVYRKALGVVSMISPWNFPLYLSRV